MPDQVQLRGGTEADNDAFTGVNREVTVDTTNKTLRVHDGVAAGGSKLAAFDEWGRLQVADPQDAQDVTNKSYVDGVVGDSVPVFESDRVETLETTTSTSYTDLATVGPSVTVDVPASGEVIVLIGARAWNSTIDHEQSMGLVASGANTITANDNDIFLDHNPKKGIGISSTVASTHIPLSGLTAGITTFTAKYKTTGGTGNFRARRLTVITVP